MDYFKNMPLIWPTTRFSMSDDFCWINSRQFKSEIKKVQCGLNQMGFTFICFLLQPNKKNIFALSQKKNSCLILWNAKWVFYLFKLFSSYTLKRRFKGITNLDFLKYCNEAFLADLKVNFHLKSGNEAFQLFKGNFLLFLDGNFQIQLNSQIVSLVPWIIFSANLLFGLSFREVYIRFKYQQN